MLNCPNYPCQKKFITTRQQGFHSSRSCSYGLQEKKTCTMCQKILSTSSGLSRHMKLHKNAVSLVSDICEIEDEI